MSDPEKARHYLEALDAARSNGQWQEVPELVRKIRKHATNRQCLCLTAEAEQRIAALSSQRPQTAASLASTDLSKNVASLKAAIEEEEGSSEDRFQALVCLAWLHSVQGDSSQVLSTLSAHEVTRAVDSFTNIVSPTARWTHVSIVKGACLRGIAIENSGNTKDAVHFYESIFAYLSRAQSTVGNTLESNIWTERLLARHISLATRHVKSNRRDPHILLKSKTFRPAQLLGAFRLWSEYRFERQNGSFFSLAWVWKAYYDVLSIFLQHQITNSIFTSKTHQHLELQRAQTAYEAILMADARFPRADESSTDINSWVDQVIANWRALLVPPWQAEDLGQGGRRVLGKNVLEILYRSATKSFHSPRILRHLFTVHAQLGEFRLAGKALDTYLEIVAKSKARFEKSRKAEPGSDDDAMALCTAAEGIRMLCQYGNRAEVERALVVAELLRSWMSKVKPASHSHTETSKNVEVSAEDNPDDLIDKQNQPKSSVPGKVLALAHRAIGTSQRTWSRLTYDENLRPELLTSAISSFRAALRQEYGSQDDIDTLFSLAYAFSEQRDIDSAITTVKEALSLGSKEMAHQNGHAGHESNAKHRTRPTLLQCWHLLALLLSAREDYEKAMTSCEAAEELYGGKEVLYGDVHASNALIGLSFSERKGLLELKLTQLALLEVLDGPEEAINSSAELLALYAKVFKHTDKEPSAALEPARAVHKSDRGSPQRSIRGSILGYPKDRRSKLAVRSNENDSVGSLEPSKESPAAPAIAVTSDDTTLPQDLSHHTHFLGRHESNKLKKRHSRKSLQGGSQRRSRTSSPMRPATSDGGHHHLAFRGRGSADGPSDSLSPHRYPGYSADQVGLAISHDLPSSPPTPALEHSDPVHIISSNSEIMDDGDGRLYLIDPSGNRHYHYGHAPTSAVPVEETIKNGKTLKNERISKNEEPSKNEETSKNEVPYIVPAADFDKLLNNRFSLEFLVNNWCHRAMNYRRANNFKECQIAITEAQIWIGAIEKHIASHEGSGATPPEYNCIKPVKELHADVWSQMAALKKQQFMYVEAFNAYETAMHWDPGHPAATIGICIFLLDIYETEKTLIDFAEAEKLLATSNPDASDSKPMLRSPEPERSPSPVYNAFCLEEPTEAEKKESAEQNAKIKAAVDKMGKSRAESAISARDRAFKLLHELTRSGRGCYNSGAWSLLGRAYEISGDTMQAEEAYWYGVNMEANEPVRDWVPIIFSV